MFCILNPNPGIPGHGYRHRGSPILLNKVYKTPSKLKPFISLLKMLGSNEGQENREIR
jgi:hypothetical protein